MVRMPKLCNHSSSRVSAAVISTPDQQRDMEQQVQPDGGAQHFRQVAGRDGDLAKPPEGQADATRISQQGRTGTKQTRQ